ncbi:MAG: penicillin-binding protein 1C [Bacteroidales bacterium]|nr:penicillin-binding protein 1C [Bacteroidales bacterium]
MRKKIIEGIKKFTKKKKGIILLLILIILVFYFFILPFRLFDVPYSTVVKDRQGEVLGVRLASDGQWRFPEGEKVPDKFRSCIITYEDQWFYFHLGINPVSVCRALYQNIKAGRVVSGASTLSMQCVRMARKKQRTLKEKIVEMLLSIRLETRYSKKEILSMYASHAPFGGNVVGIEAASWRYFNHRASDLSWAEAATLAVLPNAPALIHLSRNQGLLLKKRNVLLKKLYQKERITSTEYELALAENLPQNLYPLPQLAPHLVTYFYLTQQGNHIQSTIDKNKQIELENILNQWNEDFLKKDIRHLAAMIVDLHTNEVIAYCGNVNYIKNGEGNQVDIIRSSRSSGSLLKPLLYYISLSEGLILPHTLLPDVPVNINGFSPQNFNLQYDGAVPASEAICRSLNIPSVLLLRLYSVPKFYNFLKEIGITTLNRDAGDYGLSLILGGAEISLWDIVAVYSNMARALLDLPKTELSLSLKEKGKESKRKFDKGAVWQTFEVIKELNRPEEIDWHALPSVETIAWKTGTSYGFRDAWAVGVSTRYAVGVWVGNAGGEGKPGLIGAATAGPVMFDIFNFLPADTWFTLPEGNFIEEEVCTSSGYLKGRFCDKVDTQYILPKALRSNVCPYHVLLNLTPDFSYQTNPDDKEGMVQQSWFVLPPAQASFYKQKHPHYQAVPPFKGTTLNNQRVMQFIYPSYNNARLTIPKQMDGTKGVVTFELAHITPQALVFWHLDEDYITATTDFHKITLAPDKGKHDLTCVDDKGNTLSISFYIE